MGGGRKTAAIVSIVLGTAILVFSLTGYHSLHPRFGYSDEAIIGMAAGIVLLAAGVFVMRRKKSK